MSQINRSTITLSKAEFMTVFVILMFNVILNGVLMSHMTTKQQSVVSLRLGVHSFENCRSFDSVDNNIENYKGTR